MSDNIKKIPISIPLDEDGMIGRECLKCERYFKLKPGTGLPTDHCHCPYCDYEGKYNTFFTPAQLEYAKSIAINEVFNTIIKPSFSKMAASFKKLENNSRNSLIRLTIKFPELNFSVPIEYYTEKELETNVICDSCGLHFSIYGVFAACPDCKKLNAFVIYEKSLEATERQFVVLSKPEIPIDLREKSLSFVLSLCISAFDGLGKELRIRKANYYPVTPKNLFQNIIKLNEILNDLINQKYTDFAFISRMFQVRHLYEHNMGVIDKDFANKVMIHPEMIGRKYILSQKEILQFINGMKAVGDIIKEDFLLNA